MERVERSAFVDDNSVSCKNAMKGTLTLLLAESFHFFSVPNKENEMVEGRPQL
jgi:hypothetical protein